MIHGERQSNWLQDIQACLCNFSQLNNQQQSRRKNLKGSVKIRLTMLSLESYPQSKRGSLQINTHKLYYTHKFKEGVLKRQPEFNQLAKIALQAASFNFSNVSRKIHPYRKRYPFLKTIVLDLDQTLIFSGHNLSQFQSYIQNQQPNNRKSYLGINIRPFARYFLQRISRYYQIIVFTAANKNYADKVVQKLDPSGFISQIFHREHCLTDAHNPQNAHIKIKNLQGLGLPLENVLIVDNSPYSYIMQPMNAVPILNYRNDSTDRELLQLLDYLLSIKDVKDLRHPNEKHFRLSEYKNFKDPSDLVMSLY